MNIFSGFSRKSPTVALSVTTSPPVKEKASNPSKTTKDQPWYSRFVNVETAVAVTATIATLALVALYRKQLQNGISDAASWLQPNAGNLSLSSPEKTLRVSVAARLGKGVVNEKYGPLSNFPKAVCSELNAMAEQACSKTPSHLRPDCSRLDVCRGVSVNSYEEFVEKIPEAAHQVLSPFLSGKEALSMKFSTGELQPSGAKVVDYYRGQVHKKVCSEMKVEPGCTPMAYVCEAVSDEAQNICNAIPKKNWTDAGCSRKVDLCKTSSDESEYEVFFSEGIQKFGSLYDKAWTLAKEKGSDFVRPNLDQTVEYTAIPSTFKENLKEGLTLVGKSFGLLNP